ncbi:NAD(P)-dependent oxidoreductase [Candidatus Daviesbacteria bacterium]|nr:NAD(P)-dependent oxidoreductase [Candidatus Daviesbacteria bacterium]
MKILVLGGSGLVGSRFLELTADYNTVAPTHEELDLLDFVHLESYLQRSDADIVLNFAAFTNVDEVEKEKDNKEGLVYKLNVKLPKYLAQNCSSLNKYLIHISTDYVFEGKKQTPYVESDVPNPVNWYGTTKLLGEDEVRDVSSEFLVVRPEMPYSAHFDRKLDIARVFLKMLKEGKEINGVSDQKITPTFVDTLIYGLLRLIEAKAGGIYHLASTDSTTPYDFAVMVAQKFGLDEKLVKPVAFEEYNKTRTAKRPQNSYLDVSKFEGEFGSGILKSVSESVDELKKQMG